MITAALTRPGRPHPGHTGESRYPLQAKQERPAARAPARPKGFSLIELLVVITIMSVLAAIGLPLAELAQRRTQEEDLRRSLREIRTALDTYKRMADLGRIQRAADGSGYPMRLADLEQGVVDAASPQGAKLYFLRKLPRDPFAPANLPAADTWALRSYDSPPEAPREGKDVFDVHSSSPAVGLNGVAYKEW